MTNKCSECASLTEQVEGLSALLFEPSDYRGAYRENMEGEDKIKAEIFEVLKKEIVDYAKNTPTFKKYLLSHLDETKSVLSKERSMSRARPTTQSYTPRIRSQMIYTPRSSSRPTTD